jgi:hypothetical protein
MVLTKEFKEVVRDAAKKMKGAAKRAFMAQITREYLGGSPRKGERELGWYRKTVEKGLKEQETGIHCIDNYGARGRKKTEKRSWRIWSVISAIWSSQTAKWTRSLRPPFALYESVRGRYGKR